MNLRGYLGFALLALSLASYSPLAYAAISPSVSTTKIRDFTRLTFNWPESVRFKVENIDNGVILTFNKPADIPLQQLRGGLGTIIKQLDASNDGTRVTLTFDQPYKIRHFISGNANGIDILPNPQVGAIAPNPPPAISEPEPAPAPTPTPEPVQVTPSDPAPAASEETLAPPIPIAKPVAPAEPAPPLTTAAKAQETAASIPAPASPAPTAIKELPATAPTAEPAANPIVAGTDTAVKPEPTPKSDGDKTADPADDTAAEQPSATVAMPPLNNAAETPIGPIKPDEKSDAVSSDVATEAVPADKEAAVVAAASENTDAAAVASAESGPGLAKPVAPAGPFIITTKTMPTNTEIQFPWVERVGAAVFKRGNDIWIAFSADKEVNLELLKSILPVSISKLERIDYPGRMVLRLETDGSLNVRAERSETGMEWRVELSAYPQMPANPVALDLKPEARNPNIFVPILQYADPIEVTDPVVGDKLIITAFYDPGNGVYPSRKFPELTILESAQGLAVAKHADLAEITALRNGLRISVANGLSMSPDQPQLSLSELETLTGAYTTLFPYEAWQVPEGGFNEARQALEKELLNANEIRVNSVRLKLAQLYLGAGMGYEALGLLKMIEEADPNFFIDRKLAAYRGAAHFLTSQYDLAAIEFDAKELRGLDEIKLWKEALNIFRESRPRFDFLNYEKSYISKYPPRLREKLAILAADNYINRKSFNRALQTFDTLSITGTSPQTAAYIDFLLGEIAAESGKLEGAKAIWEPLTQRIDDLFIRARAEFSLTALLYNEGKITPQEAITRLDKLRIVWRGDSLELQLLNFLGRLYMEDKNYLEGMRTWRELITQFPDSEYTLPIAREMAETFNKLFAEGLADELEPLQALSIFYEFRDLTPVGTAGDTMIQNLADRLAKVDLLDRAAALLEHQIQFRQEGEPRSRLGAQLALIYLLNKEPEKALEILELTGFGENPYPLRVRRTQLAAMALADTGKPKEAINMLANDTSPEASPLRLKLYWQMRDWPNVIITAENLLGGRSDMTAPLNDRETEQLLQLAIAYVFERDNIQLQYLRNYFTPLLVDNPNKDVFSFITDDTGPIDPDRFEEVTQQISKFEAFMSNYREQIKGSGGISSVLN